jgi:hypothetical protein
MQTSTLKWMKLFLPVLAALMLAGCSSETPVETKAKQPEKPSEPITGRQAFQMTYPQARTWAPDAQPLRIRSLNLPNPKSEGGKAGAWEILYVSPSRARQKPFTWSAIEAEGNLHKGVFAGLEEAWSGPRGQSQPFMVQALKIDTPEALETAISKSADYMKKGGPNKPLPNFMCELTSRFPDPTWRVFWGESVSAAEWSVFIDATTGEYKGR